MSSWFDGLVQLLVNLKTIQLYYCLKKNWMEEYLLDKKNGLNDLNPKVKPTMPSETKTILIKSNNFPSVNLSGQKPLESLTKQDLSLLVLVFAITYLNYEKPV